MTLHVEFCGEVTEVPRGGSLVIGRDATLSIDEDNRFLHRRFLTVDDRNGIWFLTNAGTQLSATVADRHGHLEAYLAPGAALPLVFDHVEVTFTAGPTTYSLGITNSEPAFSPAVIDVERGARESTEPGSATIGAAALTPDQRRLILALAEPRLAGEGRSRATLPTSAEGAARLGWTVTKFNRKLDNVCQKLERHGVRGLHGGSDSLATGRRARLVEYAVATRLVTKDHLRLLDVRHLGTEDDDD